MILRYAAPIGFVAMMSFIAVAMYLLGQHPSSTFLWWVNQELYCSFRQIFYLAEETPWLTVVVMVAACAGIGLLHRLGKREQASFILNNGLLVLVLGTEIVRWNAGSSASLTTSFADAYLSIAHSIPEAAAIAIAALGLSSLLSHVRLLRLALKPGGDRRSVIGVATRFGAMSEPHWSAAAG